MFIFFFVASVTRALKKSSAMSARKVNEKVVVGTVVRRRCEEVVAEMAEIAKYDKARMVAVATPTPTPTPGLGQYSRDRPIKHRRPINPVPPPSPEQLQVAAVKRREHAEEERRFLDNEERIFGRPRAPTPPRAGEDPYGFAKWAARRY